MGGGTSSSMEVQGKVADQFKSQSSQAHSASGENVNDSVSNEGDTDNQNSPMIPQNMGTSDAKIEPVVDANGEKDSNETLSISEIKQKSLPVFARVMTQKEIMIHRVKELVEMHSPLKAFKLHNEYRALYNEKFKIKKIGYSKLKTFLATIPSIEMKDVKSEMTLFWLGDKGDIKITKFNSKKLASISSIASSSKNHDWLYHAVEFWVARAKRSSEKVNRHNSGPPLPVLTLETQITLAARKGYSVRPKGVTAKAYIRQTTEALRKDRRLCFKTSPNGPQYWPVDLIADNQPEIPTNSESKIDDMAETVIGNVSNESNTSPTFEDEKPSLLAIVGQQHPSTKIAKHNVNMDESTMSSTNQNESVDRTDSIHRVEMQNVINHFNTSVEEVDGNHTDVVPDGVKSYFSSTNVTFDEMPHCGMSLGDASTSKSFQEATLLGRIHCSGDSVQEPVYLNTHEPFCLATIGVQGAGKSHTLACVLESCVLKFEMENISRLKNPMTALVLHYDQNTTSVCEAAGLLTPHPTLMEHLNDKAYQYSVPRSRATVLVSPTYYKQRKAFYGEHCTVHPLLFRWKTLTADHIKRIMRVGASDNQLYVATIMSLLRKYQRENVVPNFNKFVAEVKRLCNVSGQQGPLGQRLALLESVIAESEENKDIAAESMDLAEACAKYRSLIIVDLTDPLLSKEEANGLFQVITEQFRSMPNLGGKLLALDEAHKFMVGDETDGLSEAIVNVARLMRHDGVRLVVSTQSPKALAPELLELVSVAVLHQFHSQDWWTYLCRKLPLPNDAWNKVLKLKAGNAMVFASRHCFENPVFDDYSSGVFPLRIRPRLTADFGSSRTNA